LNRPKRVAGEPRADYGSNRAPSAVRTQFEQQWHERFVKFASLRDDDAGIAGWSPTGLEARFRFFRRLWQPVAAGVRYVDVGCGAATYTRWLAAQGVYIVGIDYSHPTLIKARSRAPADFPLCAGDATMLPFANQSVDGVLCFGVLQAVSDSAAVVCELARVLKPGGELWIDALNGAGLAARAERARLWLRGKEMHLRYETRSHVASLLKHAGFVDIAPHWLPIVPSQWQELQRLLESGSARFVLAHVSGVGALLSHAFIFHARRTG
jgi:ubiquinone/menaquinone biosynthesis C-methylase UbiE